MEVETPLLSQGTVPDPGIDIFTLPGGGGYGDPALRSDEATERDRALSYV